MALPILMPALSPTMTEGTLVRWHKKEGDKVEPGQVMAEVETDKAVMEIEAVDPGIMGKILIEAKSTGVQVNALMAILIEKGEGQKEIDEVIAKYSSTSGQNQPIKTSVPTPDIKKKEEHAAQSSSHRTIDERIKASPLAKKIAQQESVQLAGLTGTGPHGRIIKEDVVNAIQSGGIRMSGAARRNPQESTLLSVSGVRKVIATRLLESKQTIPHFYISIDCTLDRLMMMRAEINDNAPKKDEKHKYKISVNDCIIKAVAEAMHVVPAINSSWADEGILQYNNIDIAIAVATETGLITPIIRNADQKNLIQISDEVKELVKRAKDSKLKPEEFQGGGFSISNLGMYGIKSFDAIINPPQSTIMAVGAGIEQAIVKNGQIVPATVMNVTLSCDHRVVDGAVAAEFLNAFKKFIEQPALMLI